MQEVHNFARPSEGVVYAKSTREHGAFFSVGCATEMLKVQVVVRSALGFFGGATDAKYVQFCFFAHGVHLDFF